MGQNRFQDMVREFIKENDLDMDVTHRALDLVSEVGEFSKEICKQTNYGQRPFELTHEMADELGDVLFSLCALANRCDVDLNNALEAVLKKYTKRIKSKGHVSST